MAPYRPLLIYLPGMEGTGKLFYRQEPLLTPYYKIISIQSRSNPPFDYDELINDVLDAIKREDAEKAIIVAESFGGTVGLQFALRHQDRMEQLVLINTFPYFRRRLRLHMGRALLPLTFTWLGNALREFFYRTALGFEGVKKEDIEKIFECTFSHGYSTSRTRMQLIKNLDVRNRLREIKVPVTLVASGRDKIVPSVKEAHYMSSLLPNARVIVLPDHGHTPLVTTTFSLLSILT